MLKLEKKYARALTCIILVAMTMILGFTNSVRAALTDNGDGTVTDDDRGDGSKLMWLQEWPPDDVHAGPGWMPWDEAMAWAEYLPFAGHDGWRLPSANDFDTGLPDTGFNSVNNEWGHLYGVEWDNPGSKNDITPMAGYLDGWYWTSTEDPGDPSKAYGFFLTYDGVWINDVFPKSESLYITAVRGPLVGDINGDDVVDIFDAILLSNAFDSIPGDPNWDPEADLNGDGIIDIFDAILLAIHFGDEI